MSTFASFLLVAGSVGIMLVFFVSLAHIAYMAFINRAWIVFCGFGAMIMFLLGALLSMPSIA